MVKLLLVTLLPQVISYVKVIRSYQSTDRKIHREFGIKSEESVEFRRSRYCLDWIIAREIGLILYGYLLLSSQTLTLTPEIKIIELSNYYHVGSLPA